MHSNYTTVQEFYNLPKGPSDRAGKLVSFLASKDGVTSIKNGIFLGLADISKYRIIVPSGEVYMVSWDEVRNGRDLDPQPEPPHWYGPLVRILREKYTEDWTFTAVVELAAEMINDVPGVNPHEFRDDVYYGRHPEDGWAC